MSLDDDETDICCFQCGNECQLEQNVCFESRDEIYCDSCAEKMKCACNHVICNFHRKNGACADCGSPFCSDCANLENAFCDYCANKYCDVCIEKLPPCSKCDSIICSNCERNAKCSGSEDCDLLLCEDCRSGVCYVLFCAKSLCEEHRGNNFCVEHSLKDD